MSINNIRCLSVNPHFNALLLQSFLTGYEKDCELPVAFFVFPVLYYADSRDGLKRANVTSRLDTLFPTGQVIEEGVRQSGKVRLAGFLHRYQLLKNDCRDAIIVLSSEDKLVFKSNHIFLKEKINYSKHSGKVKEWLRCSYYLGLMFSKYTKEQILYYIGVH